MISAWHDRQIEAATEWDSEIKKRLNDADIILLLLSSAFISSDYCWEVELKQALNRHNVGSAYVIPIILRPCAWRDVPHLKELQAFPRDAEAITICDDEDIAFVDVFDGIKMVAQKIIAARKRTQQQEAPQLIIPRHIRESGQNVQAYCQEVLHCVQDDGYEISKESRIYLDGIFKKLNLFQGRAAAIEQEILFPYQEYATFLKSMIEGQFPLTARAEIRLKRFQEQLGLIDEAAQVIKDRIFAEQQISSPTNERLNITDEADSWVSPFDSTEPQVEAEQENWPEVDQTTDAVEPPVNDEPQPEVEQEGLLTADGTLDGLGKQVDPPDAISASESAASDDLSSEKGIDYTHLRDLLSVSDWGTADYETYCVMIQIVGKEKGESISDKELLDFPSTDLRTIDQLWFKYSNGQFGFGVQKRIYAEVVGTMTRSYPGDEIWRQFGSRVGWFVDGGWRYHTYMTFNTSAPPGHLPLLRFCEEMIASRWWGGCSALAKRLENL